MTDSTEAAPGKSERSKLHNLIHEIIEHLDLSPAHRDAMHQEADDHFDPDGNTTAAPEDATTDPTPADAPAPVTGKAAKIEELRAALAEQDQDDEIAKLQAELEARKTTAAPAPVDDNGSQEGA
ncbi:hypothetical protein [Bradyrhizobium sp.]|uniref:hypothetical protein n=1 Tax=Bradyrhizobium sp. TaxID=376 RepID=UPI003C649646